MATATATEELLANDQDSENVASRFVRLLSERNFSGAYELALEILGDSRDSEGFDRCHTELLRALALWNTYSQSQELHKRDLIGRLLRVQFEG
jgi:hypothetical protein